jgi:uncharacterized protein (TIGR02996 family)
MSDPQTGELLFRAIVADPLDDDARIVFAEWLEENGLPEMADWWRGAEAQETLYHLGYRRALAREREAMRLGSTAYTVAPDAFEELRHELDRMTIEVRGAANGD